ncbi:MAG: 16S rRNA (cytidine(1402)-2'-O)-methyltransferase [Clostridia bacterium]|nr:16S rRNA (cytidine(1402)-2'-O)-methyltransferase [Clostridia bacterium]
MAGKLYVVGTPIGNLEDFSPRAERILSEVDFIAAEDTRVTLKLLNRFEIKKELVSYYEHNKDRKEDYIIGRMLSGETCAVVTDAGMPAISDPGENLVRAAYENGIEVESVPGPVAFATALCISGLPTGRFCFEGFLSMNRISRMEHLAQLKDETRTMIFYEAPHKLLKTLDDMSKTFGEDREIAICKELTKVHETVFRFTFDEAIKYFEENQPRGEYVLVVRGKEKAAETYTLDDAVKIAKEYLENGQPPSFAAKNAAAVTGIKKGDIYKELIK